MKMRTEKGCSLQHVGYFDTTSASQPRGRFLVMLLFVSLRVKV